MSTNQTTYGDISPRTAAKVIKELLKRADELLLTEKFGQSKPLGPNETKSVTFRRYNPLPTEPKELQEGVTPQGTKMGKTDISATLKQYGDYVEVTDHILDTHEDNVLQEAITLCGEQSGEMLELIRFGILLSGTNVFYADGVTDRAEVKGTYSRDLQRSITEALRKQRAKTITKIVKSTPDWGTEPIQAAYIAIVPVEMDSTIRDMPGFVPAEKYGTEKAMDGEIGKVENVRYIASNLIPTFAGEGATVTTEKVRQEGGKANVYAMLLLGQDAYGVVPFKGKNGAELYVRTPKPDSSDPLAQRGTVGWKTYHTAVILNEAWMARVEVAVTE